MTLPIFLRPLLLISRHYRRLTQNFTGWLEQSNDQLFGPLEQMIVAVVITGLAMNPDLLSRLRPQLPVSFPIQDLPVYQQHAPAIAASSPQTPQSVPQQAELNVTAVGNVTNLTPAPADTGHSLLNFVRSLTSHPIIISLVILSISVLIHLIPGHLFQRIKHSWDLFWPPWQDRSNLPQTSRSNEASSASRFIKEDVPKSREAKGTTRGVDGSQAEAKAGLTMLESITDEEKEKQKAILAYQAKKAAAAKANEQANPKVRAVDDIKSLATVPKSVSVPTTPVAVVVDPKKPDDGKTQSEKAREAKSPDVTPRSGKADDRKDPPASDSEDPLMAGDVKPLRSILKKSKKKPRQSKNVDHNHFMTMRGNRAHLVPFPHGLHPPPDQPRNTLWWKNIPKNADHLMAPPPVPKMVTDVLAGEDPAEVNQKAKHEAPRTGETSKMDDKLQEAEKDKLKEKEMEKEKAKMKAELEARERAKAQQAKERAGTATASVSIEPPKQPGVQVDPQVQKATWASHAVLCLLLFYIQEQLGLVLLAFFVWQQLNATAARHEGNVTPPQPIATATATAAAPPPQEPPVAVKVSRDSEIPPEMEKKMARAGAEKEARARQDNREEEQKAPTSKPDKGKGKEIHNDTTASVDKVATAPDFRDKAVPRALTSEERAAYRARVARDSSSASQKTAAEIAMTKEKWAKMSDEEKKKYIDDKEPRKRDIADSDPMTKDKWVRMSDEEKKAYMAERERRKEKQSTLEESTSKKDRAAGASGKVKWEDLSDEEKKRYIAEREKRRAPRSREEEAAAKAAKWDNMSDEDKKRYLYERQKREQARRAALKAGESSGLSAEEKEGL